MKNLCVLCGLILGLLTACGDLFGPEDAPHALWVGETGLVLEPGETVRLSAKAMETRNSLVEAPRGASWSTDDTSVVELRKNGEVRAVAPGRATVWVNAGTKRDSATVIVRKVGAEPHMRWKAVAMGEQNGCGLSEAGRAYCWGGDFFGNLGDGIRRQWTETHAPKAVSGRQAFTDIAVGARHACGRTEEGKVFCWGENLIGATGSGSTHPRLLLKPNLVAFEGTFARIGAHSGNSAGMTEAGTVFTWGSNAHGQIGDGTGGLEEYRVRPTMLSTELKFAALAVGNVYACALTSAGSAWCWGSNFENVLGLENPEGSHVLTPRNVQQGNLRFRGIAAGGSHTCALTVEGVTYCWGGNGSYQAGATDTTILATPRKLENAPDFSQLAGGSWSTCGITHGGSAYCWGDNSEGQLGTSQTTLDACGNFGYPCSRDPLPVSGGHSFTRISSDSGTTCGVTTTGALYCWGSNEFGRLGIGSLEENSPVPVRVADPL